jgi:hypothetical protein
MRIIRRLRAYGSRIRNDVRQPVPEQVMGSVFSRWRWRFGFLFRKYGWKLVVAVFLFYLIQDSFLYIILPLLIGKGIVGN